MACGDVLSLEDLQTAKKHQIFEAEVITGKAGGVAGGASIDYATNQVTGQVQKTMPAILRDIGFEPASFDFTSGGTLTVDDRNKAVLWTLASGGDGDWYYWEGALPKVIPAASTPTSTGGITEGAWRPVGDITLREELASSAGGALIGNANGGTTQAHMDNCQYVLSFQHLAAVASVRAEVNRLRTLRYYNSLPSGAFHTKHAGNEFIRSGTGTPGDTDGGSYIVLADGSKWVSTLPIHVDRFGAIGGSAPITFDSGPAFQKAVIAVGKSLYASSGKVQMDGPVYRIETKVLWPSNVTFVGNQTAILSSAPSYIFESGYFNAGELTSNWGLSDVDLVANGIMTDSRFLNTMFIGIANAFRLRGFTIGCAIGSENKCVTFMNCGTAVDSELSFYSAFRFFVRGDHATATGQYATRFGHQCNLNRVNVTYADRAYGTTLSEAVSAGRPSANMQMPDFTGSSFEGITGIGVLLCGVTYGVKLDGIYVENTNVLVAKDTGSFKTYNMSLNNDSWNFGLTKLIGIAGAVDIKVGLSNQSGDYPIVEFVSAAGLENSGDVFVKGRIGITGAKMFFDPKDNIKIRYSYLFKHSEVIYVSPEAYVVMPNIGYTTFEYRLKAINGSNSIILSGTASLQGAVSYGPTNAYVTQNADGTVVLHFTGLSSATYPWITGATFTVTVSNN